MTAPVYLIYHHPTTFMRHTSFSALFRILGVSPLTYELSWANLEGRSWTLGHLLRRIGVRYYGSEWNALVPFWHELRFAAGIGIGPSVVHFLWGEFASPRLPSLLRRKGAAIVGTFHCGARRQEAVLGRVKALGSYDRLAVVSETQIPFFVSKGYLRKRMRVLPLGVDTSYFRPLEGRAGPGGPLKMILVGQTERDHAFAAAVMRALAPEVATLTVCTHPLSHFHYAGLAGVDLLPRQPDDALLLLYQEADLMLMPLLDCSANDAILESMACGTPVMVNRVGGVPEYVDPACNFVLDGVDAGGWAARVTDLAKHRKGLEGRRGAVRAAAERFAWSRLAEVYKEFYGEARKGADDGHRPA